MSRRFEVTIKASYGVTDDELRNVYGVDPMEPNRGSLAAAVDAENLIEDDGVIEAVGTDIDYVEVVVIEDGTIIGRERRSR